MTTARASFVEDSTSGLHGFTPSILVSHVFTSVSSPALERVSKVARARVGQRRCVPFYLGMATEDRHQTVTLQGERLTIGRSNSNDVVLDDTNVSRFHAEIVPRGDVLELRDLDSRCGTRLNGRPVKRAILEGKSEIGVGAYRLQFDGSSFVPRNERGALRLDATAVSVTVDGRQILRSASFRVVPGELVAIIGESGSGKTTLLKVMAGVAAPTEGHVTLNDEPVTARLTDIGYVPQQEIVHPLLTVDEALGYAARLRLPHDMEPVDRKATIERVLSELSLEGSSATRIGDLSGGERKRAGVASELLNRPSMLFLDEPTTGLDPALESQMMELFRNLARPGSRAVVAVTHATKNLGLCDKLAVVGRGGELCFFGRPEAGLRFFGVDAYDDIYTALVHRPARAWRTEFEAERAEAPAAPPRSTPEPGPAGSPRARQRGGPQLRVLVGRYLRLLARDGRNLAILLGQVPIIAVGIAFLFEAGLFGRADVGIAPEPGSPDEAVQLLFVVATTAIWFGAIDAAREIVKERSITAREAAIGVSWSAYLASKAIVLFGLAALQTALLAFVVFTIRPLEESPDVYVTVPGLLILTSFVAVSMGLAISALASSQDQATSFIPLALIPQLLFAGAIVPIERMSEPIAALASAVFGRWSLAGLGNAIDLNSRIAADPRFAEVSGYGEAFFDVSPRSVSLILLGFLIAFLLTAFIVVRRNA